MLRDMIGAVGWLAFAWAVFPGPCSSPTCLSFLGNYFNQFQVQF
jgi:hypothetical protein